MISSRLIEFWCFWLPAALGREQVFGGCLEASVDMWGVLKCMHMHVHARTHVYMYRNCKWPPTWRHPCLSCLTYMWVCTCMCMCVHGVPLHIPTPTRTQPNPPTCQPPRGDPRISQNSITLELIKIIQFCLKI